MPSVEHLLYLPGILILRLACALRLGATTLRAALERLRHARSA